MWSGRLLVFYYFYCPEKLCGNQLQGVKLIRRDDPRFYNWHSVNTKILQNVKRPSYTTSFHRIIFYQCIRSATCPILGPINTRTGNYSAKYLFYRYDDVVAMILPVTGFRLECAKINRVESDNYLQ